MLKEKITRHNIPEIFLIMLLLISMLLPVDTEVAGLCLPILLLFILAILYAGHWILSIRKGIAETPELQYRIDIAIIVLFGWNLLSVIDKLFQGSEKGAIDYQFQVVFITLSMLYFMLKEIKEFKTWYWDIILYAGLAVMGVMLFFYLGNMELAVNLPELMNDSGRAASYLLLPCIISVCRYCMCRDKMRSIFYLLIAVVSFFTLFINYNIVSLWLMAIVFLAVPVLMLPTAELVKRDMQLCLVYFFMMSNMSLLTNYTELIQKEMSLSLEHSVYLDLLLAVGGVFFFTYWDRIPEDADRERLILRKMRRGFRFVLKVLGIVFLSIVLGGNRWQQLPDTLGSSIVKSFAAPLIDEIDKNKNAWIYCMENSSISTLILLLFAAMTIARLRKNYGFDKPQTSVFLLISLIFLAQLFFFVPSVNVLPIYLLILVMAVFYREEKQRMVVSKINFEKEIMKK